MASTKIHRTFGTPTDLNKWTYSAWIKLGPVSTLGYLFECTTGASNFTAIKVDSTARLFFGNYNSGYLGQRDLTKLLRDPSAWYHIVAVWDSDNGTAADRMKLYVNGVQETTYHGSTNPTSGEACQMANGADCWIGVHQSTNDYFSGEMSHVQFVDGSALAPTEFGETDATSGMWKIKTDAYATPGNNGFCLKMEDRTNLDLDSSSNAHTFTTTGTLTPTSDTPSNNFATFNPNMVGTGATVSNGNCSFASGSSINNALVAPTLAASKGKWYWEAQVSHACAAFGISDTEKLAEEKRNNQANGISSGNQSISWEGNGYMKYSGTQVAYGDAMADATLGGTTLGFFADLDNNKLYLAEDGVIQNSGTGYTITAPASTDSGYYYLGVCGDQCSATSNVQGYVNFGNGVFHTTLLTGTTYSDAGGTGVFKYSPNQGGAANFDSAAKDFYAVCTKNIKAYG